MTITTPGSAIVTETIMIKVIINLVDATDLEAIQLAVTEKAKAGTAADAAEMITKEATGPEITEIRVDTKVITTTTREVPSTIRIVTTMASSNLTSLSHSSISSNSRHCKTAVARMDIKEKGVNSTTN